MTAGVHYLVSEGWPLEVSTEMAPMRGSLRYLLVLYSVIRSSCKLPMRSALASAAELNSARMSHTPLPRFVLDLQ